jgi:ATP diphosphatase
MTAFQSAGDVRRLLDIMDRLRDPDGGCPWDREQTFTTIAPYTIEEAYEVADAIELADTTKLRDELGDLLFQVVFHARMAQETGEFAFDDVVDGICDKMVRRHPHVFGNADVVDAAAQTEAWEAAKAAERHVRSESSGRPPGVLDDVARGLPALARAVKLQKRAARVGFDWPDAHRVIDKIDEELGEVKAEVAALARSEAPEMRNQRLDAVSGEIGDLLFAVVNLARHYAIDPEAALRATNAKFERRFQSMESALRADGCDIATAGLARLEVLWEAAKRAERESERAPGPSPT